MKISSTSCIFVEIMVKGKIEKVQTDCRSAESDKNKTSFGKGKSHLVEYIALPNGTGPDV